MEYALRRDNITFKTATSQKEFNKLKGIWLVRYADDFIITSHSKECLENDIIPKITNFLSQRGLRISYSKTRITDIYKTELSFLGWRVRTPERNWKYNKLAKRNSRTFIMRPDKPNTRKVKSKIKAAFNVKYSMRQIVKILNPILRG